MATLTEPNPVFGGIVQPGAYSRIDTSALSSNVSPPDLPTVAVLGTSLGGAPLTPMYFRSSGMASQVLRGGVGPDCVRMAFSGGAPTVCFVRVGNSPTQGLLALAGSGGTVMTLTAQDYGSWTNSIKIAVAASNKITISYVDALGSTYTEFYDFSTGSPTVAQMVATINGTTGALYGYQPSNFVTAAAGVGTLPLSTITATALATGADGLVPVAGDWTNALAKLETESVDIIVPASGDASVHAQVLTHCQNMSQPGARRERTAVIGGVLAESVATVITRVGSVRDKRVQLVYPGIQDFAATGALTTYDPFYAAAKLAGIHCSLPDEAVALTHMRVPVVGVEANLSTVQGGALDQLLNAGVTPIAPAPGSGYWIVDSLSTDNTGPTFRDFHKVRSADAVSQRLRRVLEATFVGTKNLGSSQEAITNVANEALSDMASSTLIRAYLSASVVQSTDPNYGTNTFLVNAPVMLVDTTKFILLTVALQPASALNVATTQTTS